MGVFVAQTQGYPLGRLILTQLGGGAVNLIHGIDDPELLVTPIQIPATATSSHLYLRYFFLQRLRPSYGWRRLTS